MKIVFMIVAVVAILRLFCGEYEMDVPKGVFRFSSEEAAVEKGVSHEFTTNTEQFVEFRHVVSILEDRTNLYPVRFKERNRLKNGELLMVRGKIFGNNKDGNRYIFYFYGKGNIDTCTRIMDTELGLLWKYELVQFKQKEDYSWMEIRSKYIILE